MKASEVYKIENVGKKYEVGTDEETVGVFELDGDGEMGYYNRDIHSWEWLTDRLSPFEIVNAYYEEMKE